MEFALVFVLIGLLFVVPLLFRRASTKRDSVKAVVLGVVLVAIGGVILVVAWR